MVRDVSEREFVNYVRGAGGYIGYSDAYQVVEAVFSVVKASFTEESMKQVESVFPAGILALWKRVPPAEQKEIQELGLVKSLDRKKVPGNGKRAVRSVFAALSEKLQEKAPEWEKILDGENKHLWEEGKNATPCQNAGEFL